jgi:rare lipoprotein A (peptidoglycan hydrolase)
MGKMCVIGCAALAAATALALPGGASAQVSPPAGGTPTSSQAASTSGVDPTFYDLPFGARDLSAGMTGTDVKTLNWVLRGLALGTLPSGSFDSTTDSAVRSLQASAGVSTSGVVDLHTRKAMAGRMLNQHASWYGPGFYGNTTACGQKLRKGTVGVAHKKLPCGTKVTFAYEGRWVRAKVIDRGPYIPGRKWDLTYQAALQLGTIDDGTAMVKAIAAP